MSLNFKQRKYETAGDVTLGGLGVKRIQVHNIFRKEDQEEEEDLY